MGLSLDLNWVDYTVFVGFVALVIFVGLWKSVRTKSDTEQGGAQGYFLAGRGLAWWLVGFSLIAANISTEQFVGMSGSASNQVGLAIASYEWIAAVSLVIVAFVFLPKFLRAGVYTIPEFLEHRFTPGARWLMALCMMVMLVGVPTSAVIYSGAKTMCVCFANTEFTIAGHLIWLGDLTTACWIIGVLAAIYVFAGGLKACAWADLFQGSALIIAGLILAYLILVAVNGADPATLTPAQGMSQPSEPIPDSKEGMIESVQGGIERLYVLNNAPADQGGKLHMSRPATDMELPWTALLLGIWIPNLYYWGLNQYIVQRTLGSRSLAAGQKGLVFAAFLKLIIPFAVVIPGILAWNLYKEDLREEATTNMDQVVVVESFRDRDTTEAKPLYVKFDLNYAKLNPGAAEQMYRANCELLTREASTVVSTAAQAAQDALKPAKTDEASATEAVEKTPETTTIPTDTAWIPSTIYAQVEGTLSPPIPEPVAESSDASQPVVDTVDTSSSEPVSTDATTAAPETEDVAADTASDTAEEAESPAQSGIAKQEAENARRAAAAIDYIRQMNQSNPATMTPEQIFQANQVVIAEVSKQERMTDMFTGNSKISTELIGYDHNAAFPILMKKLLSGKTGYGLIGFILAAMFGAIVSSLAAMLNSASTIATMDIYNKLHRTASDGLLVFWGRIFIILFVGIAIWIAPKLGSPAFGGIFTFIQEFQGFISPGILAVFIFGMFIPWTPRACGVVGLLLSPIIYGVCKWACPLTIPFLGGGLGDVPVQEWAFLNRMALTFAIVVAVLLLMTIFRPMKRIAAQESEEATAVIELRTSWLAVFFGLVVIALTAWLYKIFW